MVEQNYNKEKKPDVDASMIKVYPENPVGQIVVGKKDCKKTIGEDIEVVEIGTVDFNSKDISDYLKRQMLENFRRRTTDYALSIKSMIKQKPDRAIREGLRKNLVQEEK